MVDSKVPRGKAAFHTLLPAAAFLIDAAAPPAGKVLVALTAAAMAASVIGGPRYSLIGRMVRAIHKAAGTKPGKPEAAAPHRFAESLGAGVLGVSALAFALGASVAGWVLALLVSALAALNWLGGICIGCQMYLLIKRLQGRRALPQ